MPAPKSIATLLSETSHPIRSADAILFDDLVVCALLASDNPNTPTSYVPITLGKSFGICGITLFVLQEIFNAFRDRFEIDNPGKLAWVVRRMCIALEWDPRTLFFKGLSVDQEEVLEWCITAYASMLDPCSRVRVRMFPSGKGIGLVAQTPIPPDVYIWELCGMLPHDNTTPQSGVSLTTVPKQCTGQHTGEERVLFGPLRFLNHACLSFNTEYVVFETSSLFVARTLYHIRAGEELTVHYGREWFGDQCLCADCHIPSDVPSSLFEQNMTRPAFVALNERYRLAQGLLEN